MHVDIVIVNWNSGDYLRACLASVFTSENGFHINQVIVIDNNSTDNSMLDLYKNDKIIFIKNKENIGFSKACNQGFKMCGAKYILLLNPDAKLLNSTLNDCFVFMENNNNVDILGCQLLDEHNNITISCSRFPTPKSFFYKSLGLTNIFPKTFTPPDLMIDWDHKESAYVDQVMGAFMFMKKELFEKLGYFDERFFVYFEELDFSKRLAQYGGKTYFNADIKTIHSGHSGHGKINAFRLSLFLKSKLLYAKKHFSKTGYCTAFIATVFLEPFTRIFFLLAKGRFKDARQIVNAYRLFIRDN
jgi:N-acetylglucosaminyl-diphospho-decaprenol L-rhamnosyltransferase